MSQQASRQCNLEIPHRELRRQAQKGNIKYLRAIYRHLGYVQYDKCITQVALCCHQYGFWNEFVQLSKWTLPRENYPWDARIKVIADLFMGYRDHDEHHLYDLFCPLYDAFLLPSAVSDLDLSHELEKDLCIALALHPPRRDILRYLIEQKGSRFKTQHLELAQLTFDRDLVQYVRHRLHPDCVNTAPVSLTDPEPNDNDLICIVLDAVRVQYHACDYDAVVQFLLDYPVMINKLYSLLEYLQELLGQEATTSDDDDDDDEFLCPDEMTPEPFYRQGLAQQLAVGVLDADNAHESGFPEVAALPLEAVRSLKSPPLARELWSRPPSASSSWIETLLLRWALHSPTIVEDVQFMCQIVFIMADQEYPGLERWDLVDQEQGIELREFQPDCVPNRARFLSGRRHWFQDVRSELVHLHSTNCDKRSSHLQSEGR